MQRTILLIGLFALAVLISRPVMGAEFITNGGFETGNFTGWTAVNSTGFWLPWQVTVAGAGGTFNPPFFTAPQEGVRDAWQGTATTTPASPFTLDQTITLPAGQPASITWKQRFQVNLVDFCTTVAACGIVTFNVQVLNTSNTVLETLWSVTAPALVKTDTGWQTVIKRLNAYAGQTIKIRFITVATVFLAGPGQLEIDGVSVQSPSVVTAASASIAGRLATSDGQPISGGTVTLTDGPVTRTAVSNPFGYYRFDDVSTGRTYVIGASSKRYSFPNSPIAMSLGGDLLDLNFLASP
jgi:hypothetical protein